MKRFFPTPRLLPLTIMMLAAVFLSKLLALTTDWTAANPSALIPSALIPAAWAEGHEPPAKPVPVKAESKPAAPEAPAMKEPPEPPGPPPISESEKAVLLELRQRRQDLEARESALTSRESTLKAAEQRLSGRVEEMQGLQKKLETLDSARQQQEDAAWKGLVKVYETMKPREAGTIFNELEMPVLLSVIARMKEAKAAAILAAMTPDKARDVTTQLALARTRAAAAVRSGDPTPAPPSAGAATGHGT